MKKLLFLSLLSFSHISISSETIISLDQVAAKVKESNFSVLENAQRVYQAKETINFSKRNLLPRLNFWSILKLPIDWTSAVDIVQDLAPFLVPNNWFRVSQSNLFYLAQKEQYRALWANQVMTAKLLYINTLRDVDFLNLLRVQRKQLQELVEIAETRAIFGDVPPQVVKFLKIRSLEVSEDIRSLENLVYEEKKGLSFLMGIPQEDKILLKSINLPSVEEMEPISFDTFIFRALDNAPEINQYEYIKEALNHTRKEVYFSFLGSSSTARGLSGGIFDSIPIQDGLGFGLSSSLRISRSEREILEISQKATSEVIKKSLYVLVNSFNSYVENIDNQNNRFQLAQENHQIIKTQLALGMNLDPLEMLESIQNLFDASVSLVNYKYDVVTTMEKVKRTIFNEDYSKIEGKLENVLQGTNL
jgi:outer membrane protein TolC